MALILLRKLPGVELLEYRVQCSRWDDYYEDWADNLAEELFGISEHDIPEDDWDNFPVMKMMRDESDAYWAGFGWDVTDGKGKQLEVMHYLTRPLVYVVEKRHPDARYTPSVDDWARKLEEDAKNFKPTQYSRPR